MSNDIICILMTVLLFLVGHYRGDGLIKPFTSRSGQNDVEKSFAKPLGKMHCFDA